LAAITPFLNEQPEDDDREIVTEPLAPLAALGDEDEDFALAKLKEGRDKALAYTHAELTRFHWNRILLERELATKRYWVAVEDRDNENKGQIVFRLDSPVRKDTIPWSLAPGAALDSFALWGEASKMACPTFDLPAGAPAIGGACPGATIGQSTVDEATKEKSGMLGNAGGKLVLAARAPGLKVPVRFREGLAICQFCYASGGNYAYANIQGAEVLRFWWARWLVRTPEGRDEFARVVLEGLRRRSFPRVALDRHGILPIRVHSSGDVFNLNYAKAWVKLANLAAQVDKRLLFWMPTRTWAVPGWTEKWPEILSELRQPNLVIRPSSYHTNDAAPGPLVAIGKPGAGGGTTAIFKGSGMKEQGARADVDCPVYSSGEDAKTCDKAVNPLDGKMGCRICWNRPDLRVNYTVH